MAKQTFTTGQILTAAQMTSLQQTAMGGGSFTAKTVSYVLVAADAGTTVAMNAAGSTTITVNTGLFAAGDRVFIQNIGAGVCTITPGTATVATSGSLVLAQNQGGELNFTSASASIFFQYATPASGDIEGVTAGTGISGGGTSGTVTVTNSMATAIDAKGDLIVGTGADAFSRLAVGANNTTLVADSAEATGLKWAAPASGGGANWSLLNSGGTALTGAQTITVSGISGVDKILFLIEGASSASASSSIGVRFNTDTASNYYETGTYINVGSTYAAGNFEVNYGTGTKIQFANLANNASSQAAGYLMLTGCNAAGVKAFTFAGGAQAGGGSGALWFSSGGVYNSASTISSISLNSSSGNFDNGTIYVYTSA